MTDQPPIPIEQMSTRLAAQHLGCSPTTVFKQRRLSGGAAEIVIGLNGRRQRGRRDYDLERRAAELQGLRQSGMSYRQIAAQTGWSVMTIKRACASLQDPEKSSLPEPGNG